MIAIINRDPFEVNPQKEIRYEVKVNHKPICMFKHKPSEGIIVCIEKALKELKNLESLKNDRKNFKFVS